MNETISVIVPIYKVEKYIDKCLMSIINQSYHNLEIILIDDGSPDNSGKICDEYAQKDARIRVIHKENGGLSSARNAALDVMKGSWVICVDSDDYIHPDMINRLYNAAVTNSAQISIGAHYELVGDRLSITERIDDDVLIWDKQTALWKLVEDEEIKSYAWGKLYRSDLFEGVRYPYGRNYEDIATTYYLFDKAERIVKVPEYLYFYLRRSDSISYNDSTSAWHKGCHASCIGQEERAEYFKKRGYQELYNLAMSKLLPYLYSDIISGYSANVDADVLETKEYLTEKKAEFISNPLISENNKKLLPIYLKKKDVFNIYSASKGRIKKALHYIKRIKAKIKPNREYYDFALESGKKKRIIYFELPCFDNLGDHAIAYVTEKIILDICEKHKDCQYFTVGGWGADHAIASLRGVLGPEDLIICQGGGNFGNLYDFAEIIRRKILKAFRSNHIIIMPQTLYYTDDAEGKRELRRDQKVINSCQNLTLFARDAKSYRLMKEYFKCEVYQLHDIVSMYDASKLSSTERKGFVVCLRSDKEGSLSALDKLGILKFCEEKAEKVLVTDTCIHYEISREDRPEIIEKKLALFGSSKMVITDRLHGMIFSMITKTPCIVIGNNHHKVHETYKTFEDCPYLKYISNLDELEEAEQSISTIKEPQKMDMSKDIDKLTGFIVNQLL